jgi:hypothetical protein
MLTRLLSISLPAGNTRLGIVLFRKIDQPSQRAGLVGHERDVVVRFATDSLASLCAPIGYQMIPSTVGVP